MNAVQKALWYVEMNTCSPLSLEDVAHACNVSPWHLTRMFTAITGTSLMRYVRARRLTVAARQLAAGAQDIFSLALDAGYGSHEAFTRAFGEHFGLTPEQVRAQRHLENIKLQEIVIMPSTTQTELAAPRIVTMNARTIGGIVEHYDCNDPSRIPEQWQRFAAHIGHIAHQVEPVAYGVCYNFDDVGFYDYMCGVELSSEKDLPKGFKTTQLPKQRYAVFAHPGHVAGIRDTISAVWAQWYPTSGYKAMEGAMLERYGPEFDPRTGMGGLEIWIAIEG